MIHNATIEEVTKFQAMASDWWNPLGVCRPLHEINPIRLQFVNDRCELTRKAVLDIGCGGGILAESMAMRGAMVTGIDLATDLLKMARTHALENNVTTVRYIDTSAEEYAKVQPRSFDIITCMELLEHVPDPKSLIQAMAQLIKPTGQLFFSTLNRTPKSYLFTVLGAEYVLNLLPRGTHQYEKFIRPTELDADLRSSGFTLKELSGIDYNPFLHKASMSSDLSVNYIGYATAAAL